MDPTLYRLALFAHVLGMIGFFMALGVYVFGLAALRRARPVEQVRAICRMIFLTDAVAVVGILLLAAAGLSMALTTWNVRIGWIAMAIVSFILIAPIGPLIVERRLHAIDAMARATEEGPVSDTLARRISDPTIGAALAVLIALLLGIIFLMTTKPVSVAEAILPMLVALAAGLTMGAPLWWLRRVPSQDAVAPQRE
jgi:small-conductance mechanosensitive channel